MEVPIDKIFQEEDERKHISLMLVVLVLHQEKVLEKVS